MHGPGLLVLALLAVSGKQGTGSQAGRVRAWVRVAGPALRQAGSRLCVGSVPSQDRPCSPHSGVHMGWPRLPSRRHARGLATRAPHARGPHTGGGGQEGAGREGGVMRREGRREGGMRRGAPRPAPAPEPRTPGTYQQRVEGVVATVVSCCLLNLNQAGRQDRQ